MTNIKMSTITFGGEEIFNITDEKSVHFNKAQTLTEEEKKQARTNIGAVSAEEVGKLSEDIATKASAIKEKASGEVIVATDSTEGKPLRLAIDGKSEQNQYSGTNWFDESSIETGTINPETGEDASDANFYRSGYLPIVNGSYVFSCKGLFSQHFRLFFYDTNKNYLSLSDANINRTVEFPSGVAYYRGRWKKADGITEIMINSGETALPYEPYCGGIPSPNPSYPQEIRNIGVYDEASGKYAVEVKCTGKNLISRYSDAKVTHNGVTATYSNDGTWALNGTGGTGGSSLAISQMDSSIFDSIKGKNVIISGCPQNGSETTFYMQLWSRIDYSTTRMTKDCGTGGSIVFPESVTNWNVCIMVREGVNVDNLVFKPMIRYTEITDDTYEPYKETTSTVYLDEPLRKGDKAYWKGGKLIVERNRAVEVYDGSDDEKWKDVNTETDGLYRVFSEKHLAQSKLPISIEHTSDGLCTAYKEVSSAATHRKTKGIAISIKGTVYVYDSDFNTSDISLWKAHLAKNPFTLEYELAEPITEEIDINFDGLTMFYPTTILSNDCNANMEVTYIADTKAYIDKKFAELATAMV